MDTIKYVGLCDGSNMPISTWNEFKLCLIKIPTHYKKDLILQLQRLRQRSKSVEEYYKEIEILLIKCDLGEGLEEKMARS